MNLAHYPAQQQYPQIQPKARASCLRCRNHKKKCTPRVSGACERCYSIGVDSECSHSHELITPTTPSFPLPPPPLLLNTTTTPITAPDQNKSPNTPTLADGGLNWFDRQSGSTTPPPSQPVLTQIMNAFETPLIQGDELAMEDPDLMPTREDWDLVYRYCTKNGTCRPLMVAMDGEYHVSHYFGQSAVLRLISAAVSALRVTPPVPERVALSYFKRARKAVIKASMQKPHLETVQAYNYLYIFCLWKGQPVVGQRFLKQALDMIVELKLDVDPDYSPWLQHLGLSERQKEDRRRSFWCSYSFLKWEQAVSSDAIQMDLRADRIKPPSQVNDPNPIFASNDSAVIASELFSLIWEIKKHHAQPPRTPQCILTSESGANLTNLLLSIHSKLPTDLLLVSTTPETLSPIDYTKFLNQLSHIPFQEIERTLNLNLNALATISLLHRPKLFLSALPKCVPQNMTPESTYLVSAAINQSLESAHRIACILSFALDVSEGAATSRLPPGKHVFYKPGVYAVYAVFEAMIVYWFVQCRMQGSWWGVVNRGGCRRDVLRGRVAGMVQFVKRVGEREGTRSGAMVPIWKCMEAMMGEMDALEAGVGVAIDEELVLGMKVISLVEGGDSADMEAEEVREPWAFLGLLGLEVAGGVRWRGRGEESWRLFWKLWS